MDNSFFQRFITKIGITILVVSLVDLAYVNYWILQQSKEKVAGNRETSAAVQTIVDPSPTPDAVSSPAAAATPATETVIREQTTIQQQTVVQTAQKEIFVPIGGGSTSSSLYVNLPGVQVNIDSSKYSGIASVVFEANMYVTDGKEKMYAQLYNSTASRPVWFSEISTGSATGTLVTSSPITLDPGSNTYTVQAKTNLTQYPANVQSARIHITLK